MYDPESETKKALNLCDTECPAMAVHNSIDGFGEFT